MQHSAPRTLPLESPRKTARTLPLHGTVSVGRLGPLHDAARSASKTAGPRVLAPGRHRTRREAWALTGALRCTGHGAAGARPEAADGRREAGDAVVRGPVVARGEPYVRVAAEGTRRRPGTVQRLLREGRTPRPPFESVLDVVQDLLQKQVLSNEMR